MRRYVLKSTPKFSKLKQLFLREVTITPNL
ncbi:hypothetical protein CoNPh11_CDS0047 [Staphylococcus phage S-CoN_Ph11]|nr:hypothetical protein CoNPh1_CDS0141 [Staphylococcus phage S-CoN_Ph1]WNM51574.1 hypothetical protein CoNPh2_CDS0019 [Staphylococcus phage S-CoN_Ph2]WNM51736.1 hypothetical protein CoNPh3_CDS0021 [Staphylococcus phage S-CoN_Ph3]WNM52027.1 hypothetical protein CoNPh4_CDS0152 [Staphylococcus phage S-CoN_Ph4]WNM52205.1 hypothetical protein CoNPh5_CDS0160 [Staphylococcus phage S-CoN_Ph5]WNM52230.1 hypothetical protein CoNPh6_CDS0019 [Staphylococcus phage S-CoN_Ph6]WNM52394.1 hypothetical protein